MFRKSWLGINLAVERTRLDFARHVLVYCWCRFLTQTIRSKLEHQVNLLLIIK